MRKPNNLDKKYLMIFSWIMINTIIGLIIAMILSIGVNNPFISLLIVSQVFTHLVASFATMAGYVSGYLMHDKPNWLTVIVVFPISIAGALLGVLLSLFVSKWFNYKLMHEIVEKLILPALVITIFISILTTLFEIFKFKRLLMVQDLKNMKRKISEIENISQLSQNDESFTVKEGDAIHKLYLKDIVYLSSHGKKCIIHCEQSDYELSKLLKDVARELPPEPFIRIHKQFIINILYAVKMKYYKGGRYLLYLNDEENTVLPVGGIYKAQLKNKLTWL